MVDFPLIPPLDKNTLTSLALVVVLFIKKQKNPIFKSGVWNKYLFAYLIAIVISTLTNFDANVSGGVHLTGASFFDVLVDPLTFLLVFMPFFLGRNFFNDPQDTEYMFKTLAVFALIYTIPMLWELRFSPQLHTYLYGYFPGEFLQQVRSGGFRPVVFIGHGLALAFWFSTCIIATLALYKTKVKPFGLIIIIYLITILVLCKTVSVVIYIIFAAILMFFLKQKKQLLLTLTVTTLVMVYPFNATSQFIKNDDVLDYVRSHSVDRAQSLETRFVNEEQLIERALERPYFGWSGWGRNRVYRNSRDITVTDGQWVIVFGYHGAVGFLFYYMILIYPIILAFKNYKYVEDEKHRIYLVTLVIILGIGIVDSVPNTGMMPVHLLLAGALLGQCEFIKNRQKQLSIEKRKLR